MRVTLDCRCLVERVQSRPVPRPRACVGRARREGGGYFGDENLIRDSGLNMRGSNELNFKDSGAKSGQSVLQGLKGLESAIDLTPLGDGFGDAAGGMAEESAINYDPEGLFKNAGMTTLQDGHIARRAITKRVEEGEELEKAMEAQREAEEEAAQLRRESTAMPTSSADLVDFFLMTETGDMEYFVAKARPQLTRDFFAVLDSRIGQLRFAQEAEREGLDELVGLREYVTQFLKAQESVNKGVQSVTERMRKLLTAKDKRQCILDMAAANEIDVALVSLLQQNINNAEAAGQTQAMEFMTKVKNACSKYLIAPAAMSEEATVRAALQKAEQSKATLSESSKRLIMPGM